MRSRTHGSLTMAEEAASFGSAFSYAAEKLAIGRLNGKQREAVRGFLDEKDVFVCLPTGFGKSVCFQSLPFIFDYIKSQPGEVIDKYIALVIEPTAAIMRDHVSKLLAMGISAAFINHEQDDPTVKQAVVQGKVKFVYISPESLSLPRYRDMLHSDVYQQYLAVFAIDEAHCMLTW